MAELFIIKLGMVIHYHELGYPPIRLVCQFPSQSHSEGLYDQNFFFFPAFSVLLILLQANLVLRYITISSGAL